MNPYPLFHPIHNLFSSSFRLLFIFIFLFTTENQEEKKMEVIVTELLHEYDQVYLDQQGHPEKVYGKAKMSQLLKELRKSKVT